MEGRGEPNTDVVTLKTESGVSEGKHRDRRFL